MFGKFVLAAAALPALFAQPAPSGAPGPAEQTAIVERARAFALDYSNRLQDFTCTRLVTRSADHSSTHDHFKQLETQEGDLSYVNHKESYVRLKVNGETTKVDQRVKKGYFIPGGEFGSYLLGIFQEKVKAEFTFDRVESAGERRACVFRYSVAKDVSTLTLMADGNKYTLGHSGWVSVDCETGAMNRFHMESEKPVVDFKGHSIVVGNDVDVRYGLSTIGDREFLLPQEALEMNTFDKTTTKVEIQFTQYRKYDASSAITFGPDK